MKILNIKQKGLLIKIGNKVIRTPSKVDVTPYKDNEIKSILIKYGITNYEIINMGEKENNNNKITRNEIAEKDQVSKYVSVIKRKTYNQIDNSYLFFRSRNNHDKDKKDENHVEDFSKQLNKLLFEEQDKFDEVRIDYLDDRLSFNDDLFKSMEG